MRLSKVLTASVIAVPMLWGGLVLGQQQQQAKPGCDPKAPAKIDGQVTSVDTARNRLAVRGADGATHEFEVSKETLQGFKVGDRIEAKLNKPANC